MPSDVKSNIEEGTQMYRPRGFHPVYIGDVFNNRYKVLNKIGYGVYSTVWLVRDLQVAQSGLENKFRALKVLSTECYKGTDSPIFRREILTHLQDRDRDQIGYDYVYYLLNNFKHQGPNRTHICLVFELIGEILRSFGAWFTKSRLLNSVMRRFTIQLLLILDFTHEYNIIYTGIIFVKFRDHFLIESGYLAYIAIPQQDWAETQYSVVPSIPLYSYYFNKADSRRVDEFDITLGSVPPDGYYKLKEYLAEIVGLFGPFPTEILERGNQDLVQSLFGDDGWIKDAPPMNRSGLASEAFISIDSTKNSSIIYI
ncbi:hypothetical protein BDV26DRAFT_285358 [Aspergillus bertholletiae]|uniref:non-specific serine/threonine protein kinase n=1 Tax=Aspergillus bertholletiae TaxID=1226010 RepID=A0A5N7ATI3_9EURO|nr:hypothetical protein BDV26DRAFT_285358 [Aspergillus bertholletiae]